MTTVTFRVSFDDLIVNEVTLPGPVIKIGRLPTSNLRLDDRSVSRMHAIIEVMNGALRVIDLGSVTGTAIVDADRKFKRDVTCARAQVGDCLIIGSFYVDIIKVAVDEVHS